MEKEKSLEEMCKWLGETSLKDSHPGREVKDLLTKYNISITEFASRIGYSRKCASEFINGRTGITPRLAFKLWHLFKEKQRYATDPNHWMHQQMMYDMQYYTWHHNKEAYLENGVKSL